MARIELARLSDIRKNTNFIIAPADALNKENADLVLTGVPADDRLAINNAIEALHTSRASVDIAIRIDFLGGNIDVGTILNDDGIIIPVGYDNMHLYGNGVKITGNVTDSYYEEMYSVVKNRANNVTIDGFDVDNNGGSGNGLYNSGTSCTITGNTCNSEYDSGLYNLGTSCTITGNTCNGGYSGLYNLETSCTITGNTCNGGDGDGLYNSGTSCTITGNTCNGGDGNGLYNSGTSCTITGNTCNSEYGNGLYNDTTNTINKCIISGNICITGGISVKTGTCLPATQLAMADVNTGVVTLRP